MSGAAFGTFQFIIAFLKRPAGSIAMFLVTSPIVINMPTRGLLAVETMRAIVQWLENLTIKRNTTSMFVNKKNRYIQFINVILRVRFTWFDCKFWAMHGWFYKKCSTTIFFCPFQKHAESKIQGWSTPKFVFRYCQSNKCLAAAPSFRLLPSTVSLSELCTTILITVCSAVAGS